MTRTHSGNVAWRAVDDYLVFVHAEHPPEDEEWTEMLALFRKAFDIRRLKVLVYTAGGAPNARQRAQLNQVLEHIRPPVAVVTTSMVARAAGTAIAWFTPTLRVFSPDDSERAFDHIDATELERKLLRRALAELKEEVGLK
jgi:hypothetical protein